MTLEQELEFGKLLFQAGDWAVTEKGIFRQSEQPHCSFIPIGELDDARPDEEQNKYDWMLQIASKTWVTELELYQFNTAYIFALEHYGKNTLSLVETLKEQYFERNIYYKKAAVNSK